MNLLNRFALVFCIIVIVSGVSTNSFASAKPKVVNPTDFNANGFQAYPTRLVTVKLDGTSFMIPGGQLIAAAPTSTTSTTTPPTTPPTTTSATDMGTALSKLAGNALANIQGASAPVLKNLLAAEQTSDVPRDELQGSIDTFQADTNQGGVQIGWTPGSSFLGTDSSAISALNVNASLNISVTDIQIHLALVHIEADPANPGNVLVIEKMRKTGTFKDVAETVGAGASFTMSFGTITAGADFVNQPNLTNIFTAIMTKILADMVNDSTLNDYHNRQGLDWTANIKTKRAIASDPTKGSLYYIDAGSNDNIVPNNQFNLFAFDSTQGVYVYAGVLQVGSSVDPDQSVSSFVGDPKGMTPAQITTRYNAIVATDGVVAQPGVDPHLSIVKIHYPQDALTVGNPM